MGRQNGEQRRAQIMEAALGLFSAHGFEGVSTRSIVAEVGVNEALIFHYFPTKLALFHAVIARYGVHNFHANPPDLPPGAPLHEVLTILITMFLDAIWANRVAFRLLLGAALTDKAANDDLAVLDERLCGSLSSLLADCEASGEIKAGVTEATASTISFALRGFVFVSIRSEREDWNVVRTAFIQNLMAAVMPSLWLQTPLDKPVTQEQKTDCS